MQDSEFFEKMQDVICRITKNFENAGPRVNREHLKFKIKQFSREYSIKKARERNKRRKNLEDLVSQCEQNLADNIVNGTFWNDMSYPN